MEKYIALVCVVLTILFFIISSIDIIKLHKKGGDKTKITRKYTFIVFLLLLTIVLYFMKSCDGIKKRNEMGRIEAEAREQLRIDSEKREAYEELKLNNYVKCTVAYNAPEYYGTISAYFAYEEYNITLVYSYGEIKTQIMDSVILEKFGADFYDKIQKKTDNFVKKNGEEIYPDGNYISTYVSYKYEDMVKIEDYVKKNSKRVRFNHGQLYIERFLLRFCY